MNLQLDAMRVLRIIDEFGLACRLEDDNGGTGSIYISGNEEIAPALDELRSLLVTGGTIESYTAIDNGSLELTVGGKATVLAP